MTDALVTTTAPPYRPPAWPVLAVMMLLALAAAAISGMLLFTSVFLDVRVPGCGVVFDCESALVSKWANVFGLPVSALAVVTYLCIFAMLIYIALGRGPEAARRQRGAWTMLVVLCTSAAAAGLWFAWLQKYELGVLCIYCMTTHACGFVLFLLTCWSAPLGRTALLRPGRVAVCSIIAVAATAALATSQHLSPAPPVQITAAAAASTVDTGPGPDRQITFTLTKDAAVTIRPHAVPVLGSPDAPKLIVSMFDYTCPSCRHVHWYITQMRKRYGDQLGIISLPAPLDAACNSHVRKTQPMHLNACYLAITALRVWRAAPEEFEAYDHWLMDGGTTRDPELARNFALHTVGEEAFESVRLDPVVASRLRRNAVIFGKLPKKSLPVLIVGSRIHNGKPESAEQLWNMIEKQLEISPQDDD